MSRKPIEIKISTVVAVCAILNETDPVALDQALKQMTGGSTDFFEDEFAVVDVSGLDLATQTIDWKKLVKLFKQYRLNIVAVRNAAPEFHAKITAQGLSIDSVQVRAPEVTPAPPPTAPEPVPEAPVVPAAQTMYIDTPIRAGQRIYARGGDCRWQYSYLRAVAWTRSSRCIWQYASAYYCRKFRSRISVYRRDLSHI
jgi:septum site-determining protein MinC